MKKPLPISATSIPAKMQINVHRQAFYQTSNLLKSPADFSMLIYHQPPQGFAPVLKSLMPEGLALGCGISVIEEKLGAAHYILDNSHLISGHMVLFYRRDMGPYLMALEMHLFRGRLMYVQSRFVEKEAGTQANQEILHKLIRRYAGAEKHENAFQDGIGNRLWVEEGKEMMVLHYMSGDAALKSAFPPPGKFSVQRPSHRKHLHFLRDSA